MNDFNLWCEALENKTPVSYPLIFKAPLQQINKTWNNWSEQTFSNIKLVLALLNAHNHPDFVVTFIDKIFPIAEKHGNPKLLLDMLVNAGVANDKLGEKELAAKAFLKAEKIVNNIEQLLDTETYNIVGSNYYNHAKLLIADDSIAAIQYLYKAIEYFEKGNFRGGIARCMNMQAYIMPKQENEARIALFLKAAKIFEEENDINSHAMAFANVGERLIEDGNSEHGVQYLKKALELNLQNRNPFYLGYNYMMLASASTKTGNWESAQSYVELARIEFEKSKILTYMKQLNQIKLAVQNKEVVV